MRGALVLLGLVVNRMPRKRNVSDPDAARRGSNCHVATAQPLEIPVLLGRHLPL